MSFTFDNKIKIAFIATTPFFFTSQLFNQLKCLEKNKFEIYIITSDIEPFSNILSKHFKIHLVKIDRKINLFYDILALVKIIFFLKKKNIAIVHSFTPKGGFLAMMAAFLCQTNLKIHV